MIAQGQCGFDSNFYAGPYASSKPAAAAFF